MVGYTKYLAACVPIPCIDSTVSEQATRYDSNVLFRILDPKVARSGCNRAKAPIMPLETTS
jgi:hypothetical protein